MTAPPIVATQPLAKGKMMGWSNAAPILRVADLDASVKYYVDKLGFTIDWSYPDIASVIRDNCCIFLCATDQTIGRTWVWIGLEDTSVEQLYEELVAKGANIRQAPTNFAWAMEMQVADLDANVLRIGSSPKYGEPEGPWLDASGRLWAALPDNEWQQLSPPSS